MTTLIIGILVRLQVLVVLVELHESLDVGSDGWVSELFAHLFPAVLYRFEFFGDVHGLVFKLSKLTFYRQPFLF